MSVSVYFVVDQKSFFGDRFVATVPPCWSEIIQAQKQRRNPQHLQQHAEDMDTTRTWRLESDRLDTGSLFLFV